MSEQKKKQQKIKAEQCKHKPYQSKTNTFSKEPLEQFNVYNTMDITYEFVHWLLYSTDKIMLILILSFFDLKTSNEQKTTIEQCLMNNISMVQ